MSSTNKWNNNKQQNLVSSDLKKNTFNLCTRMHLIKLQYFEGFDQFAIWPVNQDSIQHFQVCQTLSSNKICILTMTLHSSGNESLLSCNKGNY